MKSSTQGIDVSNFSKEHINNFVDEKISKIENIEICDGEYNEIIKLEDLGIKVSGKEAIKEAFRIGKSNNIFLDNYNILKSMIYKTHLKLEITFEQEQFEKHVNNIQTELPESMKPYSYNIKKDELIIINGKAGKTINKEEIKNAVIENIKEQFNGNNKSIDLPVYYTEPEKIDIEKIHTEIYKEPKDAYIIEEPLEVHKEEDGVDIAITIEEAKQMLVEDKETYSIPLKITKPKIEIKDLGDKIFKETLAKYTTIYDAGLKNRSYNLALAAKTINETIVLPGETFSYNKVLGNPNEANGYKKATAYISGKVADSYGGGVCQVSSTLYNAVLYSNLEIVERYNHSYVVNYVPAGRDATVVYGGKDFKFKNTRTYPIKIVASAKNGVVSVSIKGLEEEIEYEVELTSSVLSTTPNKTVYENNSSLEEGKEKVIQKGYNGKKSIAYKILKINGNTISKTVISKDTYKPMNRIVEIGTKKVVIQSSTTIQTNTEPITNEEQTSTNIESVEIPEMTTESVDTN